MVAVTLSCSETDGSAAAAVDPTDPVLDEEPPLTRSGVSFFMDEISLGGGLSDLIGLGELGDEAQGSDPIPMNPIQTPITRQRLAPRTPRSELRLASREPEPTRSLSSPSTPALSSPKPRTSPKPADRTQPAPPPRRQHGARSELGSG